MPLRFLTLLLALLAPLRSPVATCVTRCSGCPRRPTAPRAARRSNCRIAKAAGLMLVAGTVNGTPVEFVLDTGAPVTVLVNGPQLAPLALDTTRRAQARAERQPGRAGRRRSGRASRSRSVRPDAVAAHRRRDRGQQHALPRALRGGRIRRRDRRRRVPPLRVEVDHGRQRRVRCTSLRPGAGRERRRVCHSTSAAACRSPKSSCAASARACGCACSSTPVATTR